MRRTRNVASKGKSRFKAPRGPAPRRQLEELQNQMMQAQNNLAEAVVTASAGGGAVTVEMTGAQELRSITIKPEVVDPEDVEMLQDLIMAALREAMEKSHQLAAEMLGPLAGGMDLSGLL
jgi:DNA-binding YbaB/EbfC family protein